MPDQALNSLGPYPILQLTAAVLVFAGIAYAVWKGMQDKANGPTDEEVAAKYFFDGPMKRHLELMDDLVGYSRRTFEILDRWDREKAFEQQRKGTDLLERIIHALERMRGH